MSGFFEIHRFDEVTSTNDVVKQAAQGGAKEGFTAVAIRQTKGRGRMGREFFSPDGGLYMSTLLRPELPPEKAARITTMAAVAVCEAIEDVCGKKAGIKWVNDVVVNGRKVCGILTQAAASSPERMDYAVLGIGVNVVSPPGGFPDDIKNKAGALFAGDCPPGARDKIAEKILDRLYSYYSRIDEGAYQQRYASRSILIGRKVDILRPTRDPVRARVLGVDGDCALEVEYDNGEKGKLTSGEVSVRYDYE